MNAAAADTHERILAEAERIRGLGEAVSRLARDPINRPHLNDWLEAMGNTNPRFAASTGTGEVPPSMTQAWTMYGLVAPRDPNDPLHAMMEVLTAEGYTGVLGTNCEQTYDRYLRIGEQLRVTVRLDGVVGPKTTGMGEGYFVTSISTWYVEHSEGPLAGTSEKVGEMLFRVLKFRPKSKADQPGKFVLYPTRNRDNDFFWEGTAAGELRIQKCGNCGALRHPPGPTCPQCLTFDREYVVSAGTGTVFSYVVHHHPPIPGHQLPIRLALVDLDEGVRMVATADADVEIGDRVQVAFRRIDDDLSLPYWTKEQA
ncbi:MAG TPA: OB-fold domain-containing protein [Marmoricola sp.]